MTKKKEEEVKTTDTDLFLASIGKMFNKKSGVIQDPDNIPMIRFPSGSLALDIKLKGGYVKGTFIELMGFEASGKTTSCIQAAAEFQKEYPEEHILWLDIEKVFDKEYFNMLGVDTDPKRFTLLRTRTGESSYEAMIEFAKIFKGGAIFVDSVSLLLPEKEDESDMGQAQMGSQARLMSQGLRKLFPHASKNETTVFFINQLRQQIGVMYGDTSISSGGKSLGYYTRTRLKLSKVKGQNTDEANGCNIALTKATFGDEGSKVETHLHQSGGFDKAWEIMEIGEITGVLGKSGHRFVYGETVIGNGKLDTRNTLADNPELMLELETKIRQHYGI